MFHHFRPRYRYGRRGRRGSCGSGAWHEGGFGPAFGVRRPLRFLAYKLDLDDEQTSELAKILKNLKTERAQAEVDNQRAVGVLADALSGDDFDTEAAETAAQGRVESAQRVQEEVVRALERIHGILEPEQRDRLAYLIRTGALGI